MDQHDINIKVSKHPTKHTYCHLEGITLANQNDLDLSRCCKLNAINWLKGTGQPANDEEVQYVEIRFKNGRKDFFICPNDLNLNEGEIVAVEATPGHEIGIVEMVGSVVKLQMKRKHFDPGKAEVRQVYRHARVYDVEKWFEAFSQEQDSLLRTRKIVDELGLEMKLNDVEFQGDKTKAIFYYTAEERVDFRQLIRRLADAFKVRIEMRQIGVRQEAAKLGGIGSCGRELCCSSHICHFKSVSTSSARVQQLSMNPQKLAGQCGKLKCCLNYELDNYLETLAEFPDNKIILKSKKGDAQHQKSDIFQKVMLYSYTDNPGSMLVIPVQQVKTIISMNNKGTLPDDLESFAKHTEQNVSEQLGDENIDFTSMI